MSYRRLEKEIRHQIGSTIQDVYIELWTDTASKVTQPISVGIEFRDGPNFILSCAGDGGVAIRKGQLQTSSNNLQLRSLAELSGADLDYVVFGNDNLLLSTVDHLMEIVNDDDQLQIMLDGRKTEGKSVETGGATSSKSGEIGGHNT